MDRVVEQTNAATARAVSSSGNNNNDNDNDNDGDNDEDNDDDDDDDDDDCYESNPVSSISVLDIFGFETLCNGSGGYGGGSSG